MELSHKCEVLCDVCGGSVRFKIRIQILQSDCATAIQASATDLLEYVEK